MTVDSVNAIISRTAMDPDFRHGFFTNFDQAVAGYELTNEEKGILRTLTQTKLNTMVLKLQEWGEPPGAASLELMRFLFGDKAGQVIEKKPRSWANRRLLVTVGAVVLVVVILVVGALIVLGAGLDGSGGGASQGDGGGGNDVIGGGGACPCTCVEEERGGTLITICTDCDGNRCRPGN